MAANRAAGCVTDSCEFSLKSRIDTSEEALGRGSKWVEQAGQAVTPKTTEDLVYSEVVYRAHADGVEKGAVGRGVYSDLNEVVELDLSSSSSRARQPADSLEQPWRRVGEFEPAQDPVPPRPKRPQAFSGKVDMDELASNLGQMRSQVQADLRSEANIRAVDTGAYTDKHRRYQGAILGYDQLDEPPPVVPRRPDSGGKPPPPPPRHSGADDLPPPPPPRSGDPDKLPAVPPRRNLGGHDDPPPVVPRRTFDQESSSVSSNNRIYSGYDSVTSDVALTRAGQVLEAAASAESLAIGRNREGGGGIKRRGAVRGGIKGQQDGVEATVVRTGDGAALSYARNGQIEQVQIQTNKEAKRGNRYRDAGKQVTEQALETGKRRAAPPPPSDDADGGFAYGPGKVRAEDQEFISLKVLSQQPP
ncbi:MAG: hypothetical protein ACRDAP_12915, partial [Shewanella sp.]